MAPGQDEKSRAGSQSLQSALVANPAIGLPLRRSGPVRRHRRVLEAVSWLEVRLLPLSEGALQARSNRLGRMARRASLRHPTIPSTLCPVRAATPSSQQVPTASIAFFTSKPLREVPITPGFLIEKGGRGSKREHTVARNRIALQGRKMRISNGSEEAHSFAAIFQLIPSLMIFGARHSHAPCNGPGIGSTLNVKA